MKEVSLQENINTIREIASGRFRIILDFATVRIVKHLLREDYKYVWVNDHFVGTRSNWKEYELPILPTMENKKTLTRTLRYDFIMETSEFEKLLPDWNAGIKLIQMNKIPPDYLDLNKITGNKRYELLRDECDFLFEVEIPSARDYGVLLSNDRDYLQSLLDRPEINWDDLP
ncbi:MAG: hypothetical protein ABJI69_10295 [Balneola sp.]